MVFKMLREYDVLFVNMVSRDPVPEEARVSVQVDDLEEHQIEERLLDQTRNELSLKLKTDPRNIAIHGFTLISQRSNIKVT